MDYILPRRNFDEEGSPLCRSRCVGCLNKATVRNIYGIDQCIACSNWIESFNNNSVGMLRYGILRYDIKPTLRVNHIYEQQFDNILQPKIGSKFCKKCHKKIWIPICGVCK